MGNSGIESFMALTHTCSRGDVQVQKKIKNSRFLTAFLLSSDEEPVQFEYEQH